MKFERWRHPTWGWTTKPQTEATKAIEPELAEGAFSLSHFDVAVPVVGHVWVDGNAVVAFKPAGEERIKGRILTQTEYEAIGYNPFRVAENELGMEPAAGRPDPDHEAVSGKASDGRYLQTARWHFERLPLEQRIKPYLSVLPAELRVEEFPHARFGQERRRTGRAPPPRGVASGRQEHDSLENGVPNRSNVDAWRDAAEQGRSSERAEVDEKVYGGSANSAQSEEKHTRMEQLWRDRSVRTAAIVVSGLVAITVIASASTTWLLLRDDIEKAENAARMAMAAERTAQVSARKAETLIQALTEEMLEERLAQISITAVDTQLKSKLADILGIGVDANQSVAELNQKLTEQWAATVTSLVMPTINKNAQNAILQALTAQLGKMLAEQPDPNISVAALTEKLMDLWAMNVTDRITPTINESVRKIVRDELDELNVELSDALGESFDPRQTIGDRIESLIKQNVDQTTGKVVETLPEQSRREKRDSSMGESRNFVEENE